MPEECSNLSIDSPKDCVQNLPFKHTITDDSNEPVELVALFTHDESGNLKNLLVYVDVILEPGEEYELVERVGVDFCRAPGNSFRKTGTMSAVGLKSGQLHTARMMNDEIDL